MNRGKLLLIIACLFLVHTQVIATENLGTYPINPVKKVSPTETNIKEAFARQFNILTFALGIYCLDTEGHLSKDAIKERLSSESGICEETLALVFDLNNIDFKKKGFTRYYPFSVKERDFIIRIFDIREKHYLPDFEVFYEGTFKESKIGFQILPGIKTILEEKKAEKATFPDPTLCLTHP